MTESICLEKKGMIIEPDSSLLKNLYLKFLLWCGYLSIFEGYKFIIQFSGSDLNFLKEKKDFVIFKGMKTSSIIGYKEDRINDGNVEFFVKFLLPIENFSLTLESNRSIYFKDGENKKSELNISSKFTTLFTPNNVILIIVVTIISTLISILITN